MEEVLLEDLKDVPCPCLPKPEYKIYLTFHMWNELTFLWNELTILWNDLTIDWNDLTWNDLTMERNDRKSPHDLIQYALLTF